jgi:hypothetical protein
VLASLALTPGYLMARRWRAADALSLAQQMPCRWRSDAPVVGAADALSLALQTHRQQRCAGDKDALLTVGCGRLASLQVPIFSDTGGSSRWSGRRGPRGE